MFGLSKVTLWFIGLIVTLVLLLGLIAWGGWQLYGGRVQRAEAGQERATDGQEASKLETQGAQETTRQVETYSRVVIQVQSQAQEATNVTNHAPRAQQPLDPTVRDALRHNDEQLCGGSVQCYTAEPGIPPNASRPTTDQSGSNSGRAVPPLSVADE